MTREHGRGRVPLEIGRRGILLATRNPGKVREMQALLGGSSIRLLSLQDLPERAEIEEDRPTLAGNARKKASVLNRQTHFPALADDTGLEVPALGGRPGVHSARYAGLDADDRANRQKLLFEMRHVEDRRARFRTVIALATEDAVYLFEGICEGEITREERGDGGFGYDPVFKPAGEDLTFAQMSPEQKNQISHRAVALRKVRAFLHSGPRN